MGKRLDFRMADGRRKKRVPGMEVRTELERWGGVGCLRSSLG